MQARTIVILLIAACLLPMPGQAQAEEAPEFAVGANKVYAHASDDALSIWMNLLEDDGTGPYQIFGEPATPVVAGFSGDPVVDEDFEVRIALTPGLSQGILLEGTITAVAYIGGGAASAGKGSIASSLAVDGEVVASAPAKDHTMTPQTQAGATYNEITWTMDIEATAIAAGSTLEWIISGTMDVGNNAFMATHAARGRSHIELPVADIASPADEGGPADNSTVEDAVGDNVTAPDDSADVPADDDAQQTHDDDHNVTDDNATLHEAGKDTPLPLVMAVVGLVMAAHVRRRL